MLTNPKFQLFISLFFHQLEKVPDSISSQFSVPLFYFFLNQDDNTFDQGNVQIPNSQVFQNQNHSYDTSRDTRGELDNLEINQKTTNLDNADTQNDIPHSTEKLNNFQFLHSLNIYILNFLIKFPPPQFIISKTKILQQSYLRNCRDPVISLLFVDFLSQNESIPIFQDDLFVSQACKFLQNFGCHFLSIIQLSDLYIEGIMESNDCFLIVGEKHPCLSVRVVILYSLIKT
ncbi:hypothetical protein TRFO_26613 [Tritrichomonas foetus]|uniref:Uncharacterized protein n=1 Tax=Tritrichomonas foetus TaxID=1144522 RepID=A0A1J4K7B6_9EUKA|nr:hypothetical protein TRFO_26613 [Tritrichomonas foetus]|eukprot:OHT05604.1 hypothetical protein TRFO_26613 [Tritrichomonas foetus]